MFSVGGLIVCSTRCITESLIQSCGPRDDQHTDCQGAVAPAHIKHDPVVEDGWQQHPAG